MSDKVNDVVDIDSLTDEQLREMALEEERQIQADVAQQQEAAPARDEKGRFKAADPEPVVEDKPVTPTVYRREIDLGEGAGLQVFQSNTMEGLLDQLTTAQLNASKKIREQNEKLRKFEEQQKVDQAQFNADDEFVLSQEMLSQPTVAIAKAFKKVTGFDIADLKTVKERADAYDAGQQQQQVLQAQSEAVDVFMEAHPDYVGTSRNGLLMKDRIELLMARAERAGQSFDYHTLLLNAYNDLSKSGLLEGKSEDADVATEPTRAGAPRIVEPEVQTVPQQRTPRKAASSLVNRGNSVSAPTKSAEATLDEAYSMPLEELERLARKNF